MSETVNDVAPATASETSLPSAPVSTPAPEAKAPETFDEKWDADLAAVWDKHNPPRADDGKFAPKQGEAAPEGEAAETEIQGQTQEQAQTERETPAIEAPNSWPREKREQFASLPPDVREFIAKRESDAHSQITRLGQIAKAAEPLVQTIEQNRDVFAKRGIAPEQGVQALIAAQRKLDENPIAAIQWLAQGYGVDLGMFARGDGQTQQDPMVLGLQREVETLRRELSETRGTVQSRVQAEEQALFSQYEAKVEKFISGKNLTESDQGELAMIVAAEKQFNPNAAPDELLESAYQTFMARTPERRSRVLQSEEAKRAEEAKKKAAEAKKLASINVKSSPASSPSNGKTMDDTLAELGRRLYSR